MAFQPLYTITMGAEKDLVDKIRWEIQLREREENTAPPDPSDMPGDALVALVGELFLNVRKEAVSVYRVNLWPEIRRVIGSPADTVKGSYRYATSQTIHAGNTLYRAPDEAAINLADTKPNGDTEPWRSIRPEIYEKPAGFPDELASSPATYFRSVSPKLASPFSVGHALSAPSEVKTLIFAVLMMRLDAGYFMAGLEALWPHEAPMLKRRLWHKAGLKEWDEMLTFYLRELAVHADDFRFSISHGLSNLDSEHFGPLLEIVSEQSVFPDFDLPDLHLASEKFIDDSVSDSELRLWEVMAIQDLVMQFFPEAMEANHLELSTPDAEGFIILSSLITGHSIGIRHVIGEKTSETLRLADTDTLLKLEGVWLIAISQMSEADEDTGMIFYPAQSLGFIPKSQLTALIAKSTGPIIYINPDQLCPENLENDWCQIIEPRND